MFPIFSSNNLTSSRSRHAVLLPKMLKSEFFWPNAQQCAHHLVCSPHLQHFFLRQFCCGVLRSKMTVFVKSIFKSMPYIFSVGAPFQVARSVVGLISILVVYSWEVFLIFDKVFSNQFMHRICRLFVVVAQANLKIPLMISTKFHPASFALKKLLVFVANTPLLRITPYSSILSYCVKSFKSHYVFHGYILAVIYHEGKWVINNYH